MLGCTVNPKRPLKKNTKIGFQDRLSRNADQSIAAILAHFESNYSPKYSN